MDIFIPLNFNLGSHLLPHLSELETATSQTTVGGGTFELAPSSMTFVDDVRDSFDAAEFCATVTAAVGTGRTTTSLALRDMSAVSLATAAMQNFHSLATQPTPPDVVAAYVQYSPRATEIFTAVRAISSNTIITAAALDCLTAIVRYSLDNSNPVQALEGARSVVKEVVKARILLLYDVFVHDKLACAKKALNLLRLVAQCHPVLAKEIMSRFNLASEHLAPALCSVENNFCRVPFLDLMFVLLASGDRDIVRAFATTARPVLVNCLNVITERTLNEIGLRHVDAGEERARGNSNRTLAPSHVQKRELIAAINFLLATERHIVANPYVDARRSALAYPVVTSLAKIGAADMPSLDVVPTVLMSDHQTLRDVARRIFVTILGDEKVHSFKEAIAALTKLPVSSRSAALLFVMDTVEKVPHISKGLLEKGPYLSRLPNLSSTWFADAAVISTCILRLPGPLSKFLEKNFFEHCLEHEDGLVRHTGVLILRAYCKMVAEDEAARRAPLKFLPHVKIVEDLVREEGRSDEEAQKLLADYQTMLYGEVMDNKHDAIRLAVENAGTDLIKAESSIRSAIGINKRDAFHSILRKRYLSRLITCARLTKETEVARRLWFLSRDIVKTSDLFPDGSEGEVDVFLMYLSDEAEDVEECVTAFEQMLYSAWQTPYGLFDDIRDTHPDLTQVDKTSLLSAAAVFRLRKLNIRQESSQLSKKDSHFQSLLSKILRTVVACQRLLGTGIDGTYLRTVLPKVLGRREVWWGAEFVNSSQGDVPTGDCEMIQGVFTRPFRYPRTPFLQLVRAVSLFRLQSLVAKKEISPQRTVFTNHSTIWSAWSKFRETGTWTRKLDLMRCSSQDVMKEGEISPLALGMFLEQLHSLTHDADMNKCAQLLKSLFSEENYVLSVAEILRVTPVHSVRSFLASEAVDILSADRRDNTNIQHLLSIVQDSLLQAVSCKHAWDLPNIKILLSLVFKALRSIDELTSYRSFATFSFALLKRLLRHADVSTRIFVQILLRRAPEIELPRVCDISLTTASDMGLVLRHFPNLQKSAIMQISRWTSTDIAGCFLRLLPLLQVVLDPMLFTELKEELHFKFHETCDIVLEALTMQIDGVLDTGQGDVQEIAGAMTRLGNTFILSACKLDLFMKLLKTSYRSKNGKVFNNLILLLLKALSDENKEANPAMFTDLCLVEILSMLALWLDRGQLTIGEPPHMYALKVFQDVLKQLRVRKAALYGLMKDVGSLEKALTSICSKLLKSLYKFLSCSALGDEQGNADSPDKTLNLKAAMSISLNCVKGVLLLDLLLDKAAKRSLVFLSDQDGAMIRLCLRDTFRTSPHDGFQRIDAVDALIADIVKAALNMFPRFGAEEDVAVAISVIEEVFSSDLSRFSASMGLSDIATRDCMHIIAQYMQVNQLRDRYQLPDRRGGYFAPVKSQVLSLFERERLELTCSKMLWKPREHGTETEKGRSLSKGSTQKNTEAYDPIFVLRTFLTACSEALKAPGSALLDLGRIAKDGLLSVVVTGIACRNEEVRALSYACLHSFSKVVGPVSGVPLGSAASLYVYRRQLSFLLTLLQNSIPEPLVQVVPLFVVWFRICMRVVLIPKHEAYKTVVHFLLRAPTIDVTDCLGVSHLLRFQKFQTTSQRRASRLLGLEVLKRGVVSIKDFNIVRKHKLLDVLFMYGGTVIGDDPQLHSETFKTLSALLSRDDGTLSEELINGQGIVPWLLPLHTERDETEQMLSCRLNLLRSLALSIPRPAKSLDFVMQFSGALNALLLRLRRDPGSANISNLFKTALGCCNAIIGLAPRTRKLIDTNICTIHQKSPFLEKSLFYPDRNLAKLISRQAHVVVALKYYVFILDGTIPSQDSAIGFSNEWTLHRRDALDVSMAHSFIADGLLSRQTWKLECDDVIQPELYLALAKGMYACPTVWLTIASFCALQMKGHLTEELVKYTDQLPGLLPDNLNMAEELKHCAVVDEARPVLIEQLMLAASPVEQPSKSFNSLGGNVCA